MSLSDEVKRDFLLIIVSMLFILFVTGLGVEAGKPDDDTIIPPA